MPRSGISICNTSKQRSGLIDHADLSEYPSAPIPYLFLNLTSWTLITVLVRLMHGATIDIREADMAF